MSDPIPTNPVPPTPPPPPSFPPPPPPPPPVQRPPGSGNSMMSCVFGLSVLLNVAVILLLILTCLGLFVGSSMVGDAGSSLGGTSSLVEKTYSGTSSAKGRVAIITVDGVIMEGLLGFAHKQIEQAAKDKDVKAVVLRINSPGGSITASEDLHHKLIELRDGKGKNPSKKLVVSMGGMAASGGYYIAMPGELILAEKTTITGSIGVYAALLNVAELAKTHGVVMNTLKAGEYKDSGSPFRKMTDQEAQVWQDMVNTAYGQFLEVVVAGRPKLNKAKLLERFDEKPVVVDPDFPQDLVKNKPYRRYRADGGIWPAQKAKDLGLVDAIGNLDDAVAEARNLAKLDEDAKVIQYEKSKPLAELLLGVKTPSPNLGVDLSKLKHAAMPRLWYLAPGSELSALISTLEAP